jgi:hypothetical protein
MAFPPASATENYDRNIRRVQRLQLTVTGTVGKAYPGLDPIARKVRCQAEGKTFCPSLLT